MNGEDRALATRAVALRVLADVVAAERAATVRALEERMMPGDRVQAAVYPDGNDPVDVGMVYRSKPKAGGRDAIVSDVDVFLEWAAAVAPEEVVVHREIKPGMLDAALDVLERVLPAAVQESRYANRPWLERVLGEAAAGGGHVNPGTGELVDGPPPGVDVVEVPGAKSTVTVKPSPAAAEVIVEALRAGTLHVRDVVPALRETQGGVEVGRTVVARRPNGRFVTVHVRDVQDLGDGEWILLGYIPSRKYPGDYIGRGWAFLSRVEAVLPDRSTPTPKGPKP